MLPYYHDILNYSSVKVSFPQPLDCNCRETTQYSLLKVLLITLKQAGVN